MDYTDRTGTFYLQNGVKIGQAATQRLKCKATPSKSDAMNPTHAPSFTKSPKKSRVNLDPEEYRPPGSSKLRKSSLDEGSSEVTHLHTTYTPLTHAPTNLRTSTYAHQPTHTHSHRHTLICTPITTPQDWTIPPRFGTSCHKDIRRDDKDDLQPVQPMQRKGDTNERGE